MALETAALRGTWLDEEDVGRLLRLSLPGIDEIAALLEVARLAASGRYRLVVVDTAPTGHALRMLETPDVLAALADVFDQMQAKHRAMVAALAGGWRPDAEDAVIAGMQADARRLGAELRDPAQTMFSWVTVPEPMAVDETADGAAALARGGFPLTDVIVNRITPPPDRRCRWCEARRMLERRSVAALRRRVPGVPLVAVAARPGEPRGIGALTAVGREIGERRPVGRTPASGRAAVWRPPIAPGGGAVEMPVGAETRLLIFGGKGGVGKTTCAAAAALALARRSPDRRLLLISADPAHSLADALGLPVSDEARPLAAGPRNLRVREIDAVHGFDGLRRRYAADVDRWFDRAASGSAGVQIDTDQDRLVMQRLLNLAPPGIDELAAVIDVIDALDEEADLIVMDTAPSGHALRLLEMPALVQEWTRALMAILLKYQPVAGVGQLGAVLLKLSQGLGKLRALLADDRRTAFVIVTRAAALPREETRRLIERLAALPIDAPLLLVNAVGYGTCAACRRRAAAETRELGRIARMVARSGRRRTIVGTAPAQLPPPHGVQALAGWRKAWRLCPVGR